MCGKLSLHFSRCLNPYLLVISPVSHDSKKKTKTMHARVIALVHNKWFERFIISVIVLSGILIGLETSRALSQTHVSWIETAHAVILGIFVIEVVLKLYACAPDIKKYFKDEIGRAHV